MPPFEITIQAQIKCVGREIGFRKIVYEKRVGYGAMTQEEAHREITTMEAVLETLKKQEPNLFNQEDKDLPFKID